MFLQSSYCKKRRIPNYLTKTVLKQTCQLSRIWRETHASYKSYRESCTKLKISRTFHKKLTMSLKIAKFINKHLKVYIQEYNYVLKQQWLFLKYHDALLVSKHPIKYFKKPTANHVHCRSMQCFINIAEKWHIAKPGTAEHLKTKYRNTKSGTVKPGYGIPTPGQTVSSAGLTRMFDERFHTVKREAQNVHFIT